MEEKLFELLHEYKSQLILAERVIHSLKKENNLTEEQHRLIENWWRYATRNVIPNE